MAAEVLAPGAALEALRACYSEYTGQLIELEQNTGIRDMLSSLLGSGPVKQKREALLSAFYNAVQEALGQVVPALEACPPDQASEYAAQALEIMLFTPAKRERELEFVYASLEGLSAPLVPLLGPAAAAGLAARYKKRTPVRMMFPTQRKLLEQINARAGG